MRVTNLRFRSPKEKTGEFCDPQVTYDGRRIKFPVIKRGNTTFSKEPRFMQYYFDQKKTNVIIGPTTYDTSHCFSTILRKPCAIIYVIIKHT